MVQTAAIIIPARMASTRFPGKPLAQIRGMAMIERVWRLACAVPCASEVFIATDDERLQQAALAFGAQVIMTSPACLTGTDRVAEAARSLKSTIFFNLQGDAVLTPPWIMEDVLRAMLADPSILMATPAVRLTGQSLLDFLALKHSPSNTSGTTVTFDKKGNALYFSKTLIPYARDTVASERLVYQHIGLYGYRATTLQQLTQLSEGPLEKLEKLEQLRALENGIPIRVVPVDYRGRTPGSVDCPADVTFVEAIIDREGEII